MLEQASLHACDSYVNSSAFLTHESHVASFIHFSQIVGPSGRGKRDAGRDRGVTNGMQYMGSSPSDHAVRPAASSPQPQRTPLSWLIRSFFPAPEKQNPHPNLRPALSYPQTRTPRPPSAPRRRCPPRVRFRSSWSCANGSTRPRRRHHAQTRRQVIGALRSTA